MICSVLFDSAVVKYDGPGVSSSHRELLRLEMEFPGVLGGSSSEFSSLSEMAITEEFPLLVSLEDGGAQS